MKPTWFTSVYDNDYALPVLGPGADRRSLVLAAGGIGVVQVLWIVRPSLPDAYHRSRIAKRYRLFTTIVLGSRSRQW